MAKAYKRPKSKTILFGDLKLNRCVLELRYPKGYLYWDVCGKCIAEINSLSKESIDFLRLEREECILTFVGNSKAQASFGVKRITLSENELKNIKLFKESGILILDVVKNNLKLDRISRAGLRMYYVLGRDSYEEAEEYVNDLDFCSIDISKFGGFGNEVESKQPLVQVSDGETKVRISASPARRTDSDEQVAEFTEYAPKYAVLLDLDFYQEDISISDFNLESFIHKAEKKAREHAAQILNK